MKRVFAFGVLFLFLISFACAQGNGIQAQNGTGENHDAVISAGGQNGTGAGVQNEEEQNANIENQGEETNLKNTIKEQNRLKINADDSECPNNCSCSGSATKCQINNQREMTIQAGNSGNIIIQIKGQNASTNVMLYKSEDGKLYRVTANNETKEIKVLPDTIQEKIRERIRARIQNQSIELDENGMYQVQIQKQSKLFNLFQVRETTRLEINSETGEVVRTRNSWWGFLAKDETDNIMGATCATVSPTGRDECCMNKGFEYYKADTAECLNNA